MKRVFTDAADILNTTVVAQEHERTAHNLGTGDGEAILDAGLMMRSNAAVKALDELTRRKEKDKKLADVIHAQILKALDDINAEMDWLEQRIHEEKEAIAKNNEDIAIIRKLLMDDDFDDPANRATATKVLKNYGIKNVDDMDTAEIILALQTLETDLHSDNLMREGDIQKFEERHSHLRETTADIKNRMGDNLSPEVRSQFEKTLSRKPHALKTRSAIEVHIENNDVATQVEKLEAQQNFDSESSEFSLSNPAM